MTVMLLATDSKPAAREEIRPGGGGSLPCSMFTLLILPQA
jgi:hypothetical protein